MGYLADSYRDLNPLKTDMYQLTMAQGYFAKGRHEETASFYMHWRKPPYGGSYTVASGLEGVIDFLEHFHFTDEHIAYLREREEGGVRLFSDAFLDYLREMKLELDVDAVPEGTVVTAPGPVVRITGPLLQCQLVESAVLNIVNSSSMISTRAARIDEASGGKAVFADMSLRRSPTLDSGVSRAAAIGGAKATADVDAGRRLGLPVVGTMAHSWIMGFQQDGISNAQAELNAFRDYMDSFPTNTVMLVDTFDTPQGIQNAIQAAREKGVKLKGVRLDSGDLFNLTWEAKRLLDEAARENPDQFADTKIYMTNDLDELKIREFYTRSIDEKGKPFPSNLVFGVGTSLGNPGPLGGVYKLSAYAPGVELSESEDKSTAMFRTMKVAGVDEKDPSLPGPKSSLPGIALDVLRLKDAEGRFIGDVIIDTAFSDSPEHAAQQVLSEGMAISLLDNRSELQLPTPASYETLLKPVFRNGENVYAAPETMQLSSGAIVTDLAAVNFYHRAQRASLLETVRDLNEPQRYPIYLDPRINEKRRSILMKTSEIVEPPKTAEVDIFIDPQGGFYNPALKVAEGGSLYVPGGEAVGPRIGEMIAATRDGIIVLSQDFHPANHISFMTNHPGVMAYRAAQLSEAGKDISEVMSPLALPFTEMVRQKGAIIGVKEYYADGSPPRVRKVTLRGSDGVTEAEGFAPDSRDRGRIDVVTNQYFETPFTEIKGISTDMLWSPHCTQRTVSAAFDPALGLPDGLVKLLTQDTTRPDLSYYDERTGNQFYVVRKGMNSELDSYGIGLENDKNTYTTAQNVFNRIAEDLKDQDIKKVNVNIGGLATNFCVEFSHNNVRELFGSALRIRDMDMETRFLSDISAGIPIPGGVNDPFSIEGAPLRMAAYDKGNPTRIMTSIGVVRRRTPEPVVSGELEVTGQQPERLRA